MEVMMGSPTSSPESDDPIVIGEAPKCDQKKYAVVSIQFSLRQFYGRCSTHHSAFGTP
jgi:hypothetical protein